MPKSAGSDSLVFQNHDGRYYEIPNDRLGEFEMSREDVDAFFQEQTEVQGADVTGYGRGMGGGMYMPQLPLMIMVPTSMARQSPTAAARQSPTQMARQAPMRSWQRRARRKRG